MATKQTIGRARRIAIIGLVALTIVLYLVIVLWSLPLISREADGLRPFDLYPAGYDYGTAEAFLSALTPVGRDHYQTVQFYLDAVFPPLNAAVILVLAYAMRWRTGLPPLVLAGLLNLIVLAAVAACIFDWLENAAVQAMLALQPAAVSPVMVDQASLWTELKSLSVISAYLSLMVMAITWLIHRRKQSE